MTLIEAYEQIADILTSLKEGDISSAIAYERLIEVQVNSKGLGIAVPKESDLDELFNKNYNFTYSSSEYESGFVSSDEDYESS